MSFDPLRPTCALTAMQRIQLMKSTRKVAKLLGTTPQIKIRDASLQVIRNQDSVLVVRGRHDTTMLVPPRITAPRAISARSSPLPVPNAVMLEAQGRASLRRRAPRLQADDSGPCADPGLNAPLSPPLLTPRCESDSARAARERRLYRKRLSKLGRTFGQAVPPVLVPAPPSLVARPRARRGRRSLYVSVGAAAATSPAISYSTVDSSSVITESATENMPPVPERPPNTTSARPNLRIKVASPPTAYQPLPTSWQAMPKMREVEEVFEGPHDVLVEVNRRIGVFEYTDSPQSLRRAASLEVLSPAVLQAANPPPRSQSVESLRRLPTLDMADIAGPFSSHLNRANTTSSDATTDPPPRSNSRLAQILLGKSNADEEPKPVAYRSERRQGWSGEWNAASVQDVIVRLRELR